MQSGPSKEELSNYFKNSRMYFDELAQHYKVNDPEYYKEFIEPFYKNPFYSGTSGQKGCGLRIVLLIFGIMLIAGISLTVFFFTRTKQAPDNYEFRFKEFQSDTVKSDTIKSDEIQLDNLDSLFLKKEYNKKDMDEIMKKLQQVEKEINKKNKNQNKPK